MAKTSPISISISRQFGSGGGIIGSSLAKRLGYLYLDREIVMAAAKKLGVAYEEVAEFDEKTASFWKSVLYACQYGDYTFSPAEHVPSDEAIHKSESEILRDAAARQPIVVVGRGANFVLKEEPNHVSVFVHADEAYRLERVQQVCGVTRNDALKLIQRTDASRESYIRKFTGHSQYDLRHYNLVIDTGALELEKAEELILKYMRLRFGEDVVKSHLSE